MLPVLDRVLAWLLELPPTICAHHTHIGSFVRLYGDLYKFHGTYDCSVR